MVPHSGRSAARADDRWPDYRARFDELLKQIAAGDDPNPRPSASAALAAAVAGVGRHDLVTTLAGGERVLGLGADDARDQPDRSAIHAIG